MNIDKVTLPYSNITYKKFINHLTDKVIDLKVEYISKYCKNPRYIKMPIWCLQDLEIVTKEMVTYSIPSLDEDTEPHFMGLRICETDSIRTIGEIEVF